MSEMGRRIRELRLDAGLTQEQLGEKVGLQKSAIAKYENGKTENMKRSVIQKMAEVLGVSPTYLMGWDDEGGPTNAGSQMLMSTLGNGQNYYLDSDVAELAKQLHDRPEMRVLFDASRGATTEDIQMAADLLNRLSKK